MQKTLLAMALVTATATAGLATVAHADEGM